MNKKQLHEKLQQLHAELDQVECSDNQREILQKVAGDIQELLARQEEGAEGKAPSPQGVANPSTASLYRGRSALGTP